MSKSKKDMFRQGDVLLVAVNKIPFGAKDVTESDRVVLAHGEVTGHAHAIYEPQTEAAPDGKAKLWDANAERYLQVVAETALKHEEHGAIVLKEGRYQQAFQVEERGEEVRRVAD